MHQAQFVLNPTQSREVAWAQVSKVRNVLWNRFVFGLGREEQGADGRIRTVFVDTNEKTANQKVPAVIEVAEDPALDIRTLLIRSGNSDSFADMLGAVERNVDAIPLAELAAEVIASPEDVEALTRLGLGLVGVRFDRGSYHAMSRALESSRPNVRARAAQIAEQIRWRSLIRPLWGALARQTPGTAAHLQLARAFDSLDKLSQNHRYVLSSEMILDDVITLSKISYDFGSRRLSEEHSESGWTLRDSKGALAWRASVADGVLVFEVSPEWHERALGLVGLLNPQTRVELLEAASEKRPDSLLRLIQAGHRYDPLVDELLVEGLKATSPEVRLDALIAIATGEWDVAIPDLEDMVESERNVEARQLARAMLIQQRGY